MAQPGPKQLSTMISESAIKCLKTKVKALPDASGLLSLMAAPEPLRIRISLRPSAVTEPAADEREVLDMIKGRPEDEDFIYLDVDGEDEPADAPWSPKARVVIQVPSDADGGASTSRPKRNKRRKVVHSCLANASAKLSSQESSLDEEEDEDVVLKGVKGVKIGRGRTPASTSSSGRKGSSSSSASHPPSHVHPRTGAGLKKRLKMPADGDVDGDGSGDGGTSAATRTRTRKQQVNQERKKELKKGHRTPKQRLAQAIGLWKGVRS